METINTMFDVNDLYECAWLREGYIHESILFALTAVSVLKCSTQVFTPTDEWLCSFMYIICYLGHFDI